MGTGVAVVAAGLLLAGCGGNSGSTSGTSSSAAASSAPAQSAVHNAADVTFAQQMSGHHQQAIDMANLASSRSTNAQLKNLASQIEQAQGPEIQQMTGWLSQWGASPSSAMPSMPGMSMPSPTPGMGSMPGSMSDADMQKLQQASGAAFDKMFLQMMIQHHQGAVDMAKTELANGSNVDAKALAQRIIDTQTAQIAQMQHMLASM
jgi:uncharacterized protein (DUF305 family)